MKFFTPWGNLKNPRLLSFRISSYLWSTTKKKTVFQDMKPLRHCPTISFLSCLNSTKSTSIPHAMSWDGLVRSLTKKSQDPNFARNMVNSTPTPNSLLPLMTKTNSTCSWRSTSWKSSTKRKATSEFCFVKMSLSLRSIEPCTWWEISTLPKSKRFSVDCFLLNFTRLKPVFWSMKSVSFWARSAVKIVKI